MQDPRNESDAPEGSICLEEYHETPATRGAPLPIAAALKRLVPSGRRADLIALFDGRAPWLTIRDWRRGRRSIPQWARDLLQEKAQQLHRDVDAILAVAPRGPGCRAGLKNLMAWHARNKDKKENPPS